MPLYDYKCPTCGCIREIKASINETPNLLHCGYKQMEKQVSTPASIHFKGSGFYKTDYKDRSSDVL